MDITEVIKNKIKNKIKTINLEDTDNKTLEKIRNFELDEHEKDVLNALRFLLAGRKDEFCNYKSFGNQKNFATQNFNSQYGLYCDEKITDTVFKEYFNSMEKISDSSLILETALFLHDAGKRKLGFHPENSFRIAKEILTPDILPPKSTEIILWLIRYHDVLGNIYTGERKPGFLHDIMRELHAGERKTGLALLQALTLCDLTGTNGGAYLTDEKAGFYLELSRPGDIEQKDAVLFKYRIRRWSGNVEGKDNPASEQYLLDKIERSEHKELIKNVFGERITHVINGFYLFTCLNKEELAELLEEIACASKKIPPNREITLELTKPYRVGEEDSEEMLRKFKKKLADNEILTFINVTGNKITVDNKNV